MPKNDRTTRLNGKKPTVYSALEVSNICGVVNQTAINWIKSGFLKAYKTPGGQFRVYPDDLVDFMKSRNMDIPADVLNDCIRHTSAKIYKLLLVDDDEAFNNVTKKFIESRLSSVEILQAFDGFEAGAIMAQSKPDILILDLDLPGVNGIKLCHKIKEGNLEKIPEIIVVTGLQDSEVEEECRALGVKEYFKKPLSLPKMVETLESVLK